MPLDYDRLASETVNLTRALLMKELAPLREANDSLRAENAALRERLQAVEERPVPEPRADPAETAATIKAMIEAAVAERVGETPDVGQMVADAVAAAVAALPAPRDGKDVDPEEVREMVEAEVAKMVEAEVAKMPKPQDGKSVTIDDVRPVLEEMIAAQPQPEPVDLSPFATKADVDQAVGSIRIPDPIPGRDGRGVEDVKVNDDREVIVRFTDGETANLGSFDGRHGLGFEDMDAEWDGERMLTLRWSRGDSVVEKGIRLPVIIYRGVWSKAAHERGDAVTWGGSLWIAEEDTEDQPGTSKAWRLAAKKGRDYKEPVKA